jgi:hypothetical protein
VSFPFDLHRAAVFNSHTPCRSPAMPFCLGFRLCLSHLIYTVRPCLIHTCHAVPLPCHEYAFLKATSQDHGRVVHVSVSGHRTRADEVKRTILRQDCMTAYFRKGFIWHYEKLLFPFRNCMTKRIKLHAYLQKT